MPDGGYVGVSAYDPTGQLIAASAMHEGTGLSRPPTLTVAPGASVHFTIGLPDVDAAAGGTQCSMTVGALHLIPPNETTEVQIATPISNGYPRCVGAASWSAHSKAVRALTERGAPQPAMHSALEAQDVKLDLSYSS